MTRKAEAEQRKADAEQLLRERIGRNIVRARLASGLTQAALADELKVVRPQVSLWERGRRRPDPHHLIDIASKTGHDHDLGWFYNEHEDES
jgi:transcriptional regulator with XRE-family HTH domain